MMRVAALILVVAVGGTDAFTTGGAFALPQRVALRRGAVAVSMSTKPKETWQERAEALANPLTSPLDKPKILSDLLGMREDIAASVTKVINRESKPEDELLGPIGKRQLKAQETVRRQLRDDILPSARETLEELRERARSSDSRPDPREQFRRVQGLVTDQLDELTASGKPPTLPEPRKLAQDLAQEVRNVFQSTPEGLEQPPYEVVASAAGFEVREYEGFTVARRSMAAGAGVNRTFAEGRSFNALAGFLFGDNERDEAMAMTTPVFVERGGGAEVMSFVIPMDKGGDVPAPRDDSVEISEMPAARYAVREFAGFVTDKEVEFQRKELLKDLEAEGYEVFEGEAVTVAQYNPPYTLPTSRRNEVLIKVGEKKDKEDKAEEEAAAPLKEEGEGEGAAGEGDATISGKEPSYGVYAEQEFKDWGKEEGDEGDAKAEAGEATEVAAAEVAEEEGEGEGKKKK
uniref:SOUL heme-binding protein n=1 Tax=Hemiselmis tepida TaxID=464990 RepID=A0A7S0VU75_9CRYP